MSRFYVFFYVFKIIINKAVMINVKLPAVSLFAKFPYAVGGFNRRYDKNFLHPIIIGFRAHLVKFSGVYFNFSLNIFIDV